MYIDHILLCILYYYIMHTHHLHGMSHCNYGWPNFKVNILSATIGWRVGLFFSGEKGIKRGTPREILVGFSSFSQWTWPFWDTLEYFTRKVSAQTCPSLGGLRFAGLSGMDVFGGFNSARGGANPPLVSPFRTQFGCFWGPPFYETSICAVVKSWMMLDGRGDSHQSIWNLDSPIVFGFPMAWSVPWDP